MRIFSTYVAIKRQKATVSTLVPAMGILDQAMRLSIGATAPCGLQQAAG
jgi:hypothetical protein